LNGLWKQRRLIQRFAQSPRNTPPNTISRDDTYCGLHVLVPNFPPDGFPRSLYAAALQRIREAVNFELNTRRMIAT
jgi:hypothetical protein